MRNNMEEVLENQVKEVETLAHPIKTLLRCCSMLAKTGGKVFTAKFLDTVPFSTKRTLATCHMIMAKCPKFRYLPP